MKKLVIVLLCAAMVTLNFNCKNNDDCACIEIYAPVCGDDGKEYSNSCHADCAGVNYTEGQCPQVVEAKVLDLGSPDVDGCGWVLRFDVDGTSGDYRPDTLANDFKIDNLDVKVTFKNTLDESVCGLAGFIPVIEIVEMINL